MHRPSTFIIALLICQLATAWSQVKYADKGHGVVALGASYAKVNSAATYVLHYGFSKDGQAGFDIAYLHSSNPTMNGGGISFEMAIVHPSPGNRFGISCGFSAAKLWGETANPNNSQSTKLYGQSLSLGAEFYYLSQHQGGGYSPFASVEFASSFVGAPEYSRTSSAQSIALGIDLSIGAGRGRSTSQLTVTPCFLMSKDESYFMISVVSYIYNN